MNDRKRRIPFVLFFILTLSPEYAGPKFCLTLGYCTFFTYIVVGFHVHMVAPNPNVGFHGCFQEKCLETANIAVLFVNPHSDISAKCDSF